MDGIQENMSIEKESIEERELRHKLNIEALEKLPERAVTLMENTKRYWIETDMIEEATAILDRLQKAESNRERAMLFLKLSNMRDDAIEQINIANQLLIHLNGFIACDYKEENVIASLKIAMRRVKVTK